MKQWQDVDVQCPFYLSSLVSSAGCTISCEGITEGGKLTHRFREKRQQQQHLEIYCKNRYICCEVCRMLMDIYED